MAWKAFPYQKGVPDIKITSTKECSGSHMLEVPTAFMQAQAAFSDRWGELMSNRFAKLQSWTNNWNPEDFLVSCCLIRRLNLFKRSQTSTIETSQEAWICFICWEVSWFSELPLRLDCRLESWLLQRYSSCKPSEQSVFFCCFPSDGRNEKSKELINQTGSLYAMRAVFLFGKTRCTQVELRPALLHNWGSASTTATIKQPALGTKTGLNTVSNPCRTRGALDFSIHIPAFLKVRTQSGACFRLVTEDASV